MAGSRARLLPQVLCVVANYPWYSFFFKVLQAAEQILKAHDGLLDSIHEELPMESKLGLFISDLRKQLSSDPTPGEILRIAAPNMNSMFGVSPPRYASSGSMGDLLAWEDGSLALQVPPDCGNGKSNTGIPLARLLFHMKPEGMLTLIASLLLERRLVFVARSRDTVTAAVQAAQALIYPFRWHHIFLPLLPINLADYLSAPMPFLVGLTADMLTVIRNIPMSEVVTVDLDLREVRRPPNAPDDARMLPYGRELCAALAAVIQTLRSPTEYESSPIITGVMQEYFVRLFGNYRRFIHDQALEPLPTGPSGGGVARSGASMSVARGGRDGAGGARAGRDVRERSTHEHSGHGMSFGHWFSHSTSRVQDVQDDMLRGHGFYFDQSAFVTHRRSETMRTLLSAMRHSQMYQMFIQERLQLAREAAVRERTSISGLSSSNAGSAAAPRMMKSSSANNLLERVLQHQRQQPQSPLDQLAEDIRSEPSETPPASTSGRMAESLDGTMGPSMDPFELRVQRYPLQRRLLRERLRSASMSLAGAGPAEQGLVSGGKMSRLRSRHRKTDSEDFLTLQASAKLVANESLRRIMTFSGIQELSTPSIKDPASYFYEWDLRDDEEAASPSARERDRDHMRSWSGNSLQSADSGDGPLAGSGASLHAVPSSSSMGVGSAAQRGGGGQREGSNQSLARTSGSLLTAATKAAYTSMRGADGSGSPGDPPDRAARSMSAAAGPGGAGLATATGAAGRSSAFGSIFSGGTADGVAAMEVKGGVQVKTLVDGHRVYDGSIKDIMRLAALEAKNGIMQGLHGLASPRNSPRGKEEAPTPAPTPAPAPRASVSHVPPSQPQPQRPGQPASYHRPSLSAVPFQHSAVAEPLPQSQPSQRRPGSVPLPGMSDGGAAMGACESGGARNTSSRQHALSAPAAGPADVRPAVASAGVQTALGIEASAASGTSAVPMAPTSASAAAPAEPRSDRFASLSFLSSLKDKVAGAGNKALGILPHPGYKPQTTGEKAARFRAQLTGGGGANLLAGADGKLRQPHAPQRPLGFQLSAAATNSGSTGAFTPAPTPAVSPAQPSISTQSAHSSVASPGLGVARSQSLDAMPSATTLLQSPAASCNGYVSSASRLLDPHTHPVVGATDIGPGSAPARGPPVAELASWDPFGIFSATGVSSAGESRAQSAFASKPAAVTVAAACAAVPGENARAGAASGCSEPVMRARPNAAAVSSDSTFSLPEAPAECNLGTFGSFVGAGVGKGPSPTAACAADTARLAYPVPLERSDSNDFAAFTSAASPAPGFVGGLGVASTGSVLK